MVDRGARDKVAELLRHFASGRMTNEEFIDRLPHYRGKDQALLSVLDQLVFDFDGLYCRPYRLTALKRSERRTFARTIIFLHSDNERAQENGKWWGFLVIPLIIVLTPLFYIAWLLNLLMKPFCSILRKPKEEDDLEDTDIWPFITETEYNQALSIPRLLCGKQA